LQAGPGRPPEKECSLHTYSILVYIYSSAVSPPGGPRFRFVHGKKTWEPAMKTQRQDVIREVLSRSLVANQDELRRKLRRRGIQVTQATLSRDIHELRLSKGPGGYALPNGHGMNGTAEQDDGPPPVEQMLESFGLRVRQAMNQVVVSTAMGSAQPVAAALDRAGWPEVVGTIAGDDTVLVICPDLRRAAEVEARIRTLLES
jgi:transcriptional regulator of arginine metabolism